MQDGHPKCRRVTARRNSIVFKALRKIGKEYLFPSKIFCVAGHLAGVLAECERCVEHKMNHWEGAKCVLGYQGSLFFNLFI